MDIGKLVDSGLEKIDDGVDAGKKFLGEGIDKGTDLVGEGLERVGAEGWADKVEDFGDSLASELGATPGEQQLGETDQADAFAHEIETGTTHPPVETFGPGKSVPNYTVDTPKNLTISSKSITVNVATRLSEIVTDRIGAVHVLICREHVKPW